MKTRYLTAGALLCALGLAGCQTAQVSTIASGVGQIAAGAGIPSSLVTKAQAYAKAACGILPTAESVASIFAAANGTVATAEEVASIACQALTVKAAFAADDGRPVQRPRRGSTVTGTAVLPNGRTVPVAGVIKK